MSSNNVLGSKASVDAQTHEQAGDAVNGDGGVGFENAVIDEVAEREQRLRPTVELEAQGRIDTNHPDAGPRGLTLAAEERLAAREWEIKRTRTRWNRREDSDREERSRDAIGRMSTEQRMEFARRAGSVDRWLDPETVDPREQLSREQLGAVNQETRRISDRLDGCGWSRAAISRRIAEQIVGGIDIESAAMNVIERLQTAPGQVCPIGRLADIDRAEVTIRGTVTVLWDASSSAIQQVGLIEDETGRTKFTTWVKSGQPMVQEGDRIVFRDVAKSWYDGRVSVAVTGRSSVQFVKRRRSMSVD